MTDHFVSFDNDVPFNSSFPVPKKFLLEAFNETQQRIRKALDVLKKLNLITFTILEDHFEISINPPAQILQFNRKEVNE